MALKMREGNEIRPQTFANKADSDEDGLSDKAETATGTWVECGRYGDKSQESR